MFPIFVAPLSKSSSNLMLISLQMYLFLCSSLICCGSFTFIVNLFFFMFHITILSWHNFYTWCKLSYSVLPFFLISSFYCFPVFWLISKMIFYWITCFFNYLSCFTILFLILIFCNTAILTIYYFTFAAFATFGSTCWAVISYFHTFFVQDSNQLDCCYCFIAKFLGTDGFIEHNRWLLL